jgi:hypothetical protein
MTLTRQEIFDKVATHLLTQGRRSMNEAGISCAYRGEDGLKCAIGVLIPDDQYKPSFEGYSVDGGFHGETILNAANVAWDDRHFAGELQGIHDKVRPEDWARELHLVAAKFHLSTDAIAKLGRS